MEPRGLEKHDGSDILDFPSNCDVSLDMDNVASGRNGDELVSWRSSDDFATIVEEDKLVQKYIRAELEGVLEDKGDTLGCKASVILEVNQVVY